MAWVERKGSASVVIIPEGDPEPVARKSAAYLRRLFEEPGAVKQ